MSKQSFRLKPTLTVAIERSNVDNEQTMHLKHRVKTPPAPGNDEHPRTLATQVWILILTDLSGNTVYEVEAWLAADTNDMRSLTYEFTTSPVPPGVPTKTKVTSVGMGSSRERGTRPTITAGGAAIDHSLLSGRITQPRLDWIPKIRGHNNRLETYDIDSRITT